MAFTVLLGATDITADIPLDSFRLRYNGASTVGVLNFDYIGNLGIDPEDPVTVSDGGTAIFKGVVRTRNRTSFGSGATRQKVVRVTCQDDTGLLVDDVIDSGGLRTTTESDAARVVWLVSTFTSKGISAALTGSGGFVAQTLAEMPDEQDFTGLSIYEAIEAVCKVTGAQFYVDAQDRLHYFATESDAAPFGFSNTPNGSTTKSFFDAEYPDDSVELANAVWVVGNGISGWRTDDPSISAYGRREAVLKDQDITTTAQLNAAGDAFLAANAWPLSPVRLKTRHAGIRAGMTVQLTDSLWGITAQSYPVKQVSVEAIKADTLLYELTLGSMPITLTSINTDINRNIGGVKGVADDAASQTAPDITAPGVPTAVTASSDIYKVNGEEVVRLTVSLTQPTDTDGDLYGCWVQVTRSEQSEGVPDWTLSERAFIPSNATKASFEGVAGATSYYIRAWSEDINGNRSATVNASVYPFETAADTNPPTIPTIEAVTASLNALGVSWSSSNATDLRFYQVRWSDDAGVTWAPSVNVYATTFVITGLDNLSTYTVAVRAVDLSGNVDDGLGVAVNYAANPDTGWATSAGHVPGVITPGSFATGAIQANDISAGSITTDKLQGNTITVKQTGSFARGFEVLDNSDVQLGLWDWNGLTIRDPADPVNRFIRLEAGSLKLYTDGENSTTAITPDGIDAGKVNFGVSNGGLNVVPNSSLELSAVTGAATNATHTDQTVWDDTVNYRTSKDNMTTNTTSLSIA